MKNWHQKYRERYAQLKKEGKPFFPYAVLKDVLVAALLLAALLALAHWKGTPLEDLADPTDTTYNPRPEWYFLFLFQALKLFPGSLESLAAVFLPGLAVLLLLLVPFLDTREERHPLDRPFWTGLAVAALAGMGYLTWEGYRSPLTNPEVEKNPLVSEGQRLFQDLKCSYCHSVSGKGGHIGPDLARRAGGETEEWLTRHLQDPKTVVPESKMPKLNLLDSEIQALVAYIKSLGGGTLFTEEAPKLFAENCAACHRIGKMGEAIGPDLSLIGSARDSAYLKRYIADPAQLNPDSTMPGYKGLLTETQIEDLSRYLAAQDGTP